MNEFFKLLRDFVIFIPLGILLFGIFFSLIAATQQNLSFLLIGLVIFLYGLVASYARQIYKDLLSFLRKGHLDNSRYLSKWRKYHFWYYFVQFILLLIFIYILWYLIFGQNSILYVFPQIVFSSTVMNLDWNAITAIAQIASAIAVGLSLIWIAKNTRATEKMVKYSIVPAIDVKMIYNPNASPPSTYFWFSNSSNLAGWVYLRHKEGGNKIKDTYDRLRVPPNESRKTTDSFFPNSKDGDEITLYVSVEPAFENIKDEELDVKIEYEKSYKFSGNQWNETSWSFPDRPFPLLPSKLKKCPECKSEIDSEAKKCRYCLSGIN